MLSPVLSFACDPAPPKDTNWLTFETVLDKRTIPKGIVINTKESTFKIENHSGKEGSIITRSGTEKFPYNNYIENLIAVEFVDGSKPTFTHIPPQASIPMKQGFKFAVVLSGQAHTISGDIIYKRNPKYNPDVLKDWKDPCEPRSWIIFAHVFLESFIADQLSNLRKAFSFK